MNDTQAGWADSEGRTSAVSVIIPTFNRRALLLEALESVTNQTYRPIECVVVDDGSSDDTAEAMRQWQSVAGNKGIEFKYIRQANSGAPAARNLGTQYCTGEFIQYLDSDDLLYPEKISHQVSELDSSPSLDGVFGDWEVGLPGSAEHVQAKQQEDLISQFIGSRCIALFAFLMRRSIVQRIGPWDVGLPRNQEIDFHLRGVLAGAKFVYQPENCGLWRIHAQERINGRTGTRELFTFHRKWAAKLEDIGELTPPRRRAISDALFHSATSPNADDPNVLPDMLLLSRNLFPERAEFRTSKMRVLSSILGDDLALRAWLWRARQRRPMSRHNER